MTVKPPPRKWHVRVAHDGTLYPEPFPFLDPDPNGPMTGTLFDTREDAEAAIRDTPRRRPDADHLDAAANLVIAVNGGRHVILSKRYDIAREILRVIEEGLTEEPSS